MSIDVYLSMRKNVSKIVYNSMFSVMSLILAFFSNFILIPVFPYLKLDFSDMPIFLATIFSGTSAGLAVLMTSSIIRAMLMSNSGWIGFVMRLASVIVVISLGLSKNKSPFYKTVFISIGIILSLIFKLFINYFCWMNFFFIPESSIKSVLFTITLPYNFIKTLLNLILAIFLNSKLVKYVNMSKKEVPKQ